MSTLWRSQDFWFGGLILAEVWAKKLQAKQILPPAGSFSSLNIILKKQKHKPKPKRANGLHFVGGGLYFCLSPLSPCLATCLCPHWPTVGLYLHVDSLSVSRYCLVGNHHLFIWSFSHLGNHIFSAITLRSGNDEASVVNMTSITVTDCDNEIRRVAKVN